MGHALFPCFAILAPDSLLEAGIWEFRLNQGSVCICVAVRGHKGGAHDVVRWRGKASSFACFQNASWRFSSCRRRIARIRTFVNRSKAIANLRVERVRIREPLIGRLRDIVAFRHLRSVASLGHELHGRLEEVHVEPDDPIEFGKLSVWRSRKSEVFWTSADT